MNTDAVSELTVHAFGGLTVSLAGRSLDDLIPLKARALLLYVCRQGQPQPREKLASLLWSDFPAERVAPNQRGALMPVRDHLSAYVDIGRSEIAVRAWLDVNVFEAVLDDPATGLKHHELLTDDQFTRLRESVALYRGDFLDGVYLSEASAFEEWARAEREVLRVRFLHAASRLLAACIDRGELDDGMGLALRVLSVEPLHEETHRHLMQLYGLKGNRTLALQQFEQLQTALWDELGVEPEDTTIALYEQIAAGEMTGSGAPTMNTLRPIPNNVPSRTTSFVGRGAELDDLARLLKSPGVRLVTILAPGGMGKTHLALETAGQQVYAFSNGVFFVPLQPLTEIKQLVPTMAQHVGFQFISDERSPRQQLLDYLSGKKMLLVLDNLEHLLDGVTLIAEILQAAPDVKVLATSREKLNLTGETIFVLRGMGFPIPKTPEDALQSDAVKLLVQAAKRAQHDFAVTAENLEVVVRICRLTGGMPLGILLAAGWLDVLSLEEIANEIQQHVDFLETVLRDVPERQRSIRAIFESTWERLAPGEQQVFMKLAVFRGGFTREAAEAVAGANVRMLLALVNKSLLYRRAERGRYDIHELLRQYAQERLTDSGLVAQISDAHSLYCLTELHQRQKELEGPGAIAFLHAMRDDSENIYGAVLWAAKHALYALLDGAIYSLRLYFDARAEIFAGETLFQNAVTLLEQHPANPEREQVLLHLFIHLTNVNYVQNHFIRIANLIERSRIMLHADTPPLIRGYFDFVEGRYRHIQRSAQDALPCFERALAAFRQAGDSLGEIWALEEIAWCYAYNRHPEKEDWERALQFLHEGLAMRHQRGNLIGLAPALILVAIMTVYLHADLETGKRLLLEAIDIAGQLEDHTTARAGRSRLAAYGLSAAGNGTC